MELSLAFSSYFTDTIQRLMGVALSTLLFLAFQSRGTIFEIDLTPYEHTPVFEATSKQLTLHKLPSSSSRVTKSVKVSPGQRISFDDERYRTIQTGRFRVLVASHVIGRTIGKVNHLWRKDYYSYGFAPANVEVKAGTTFDYLQYRAEGTCFVRIDGTVIDAEACPIINKTSFRLEREPKTQLWIHVAIADSEGWILVGKSTVKDVGRE